MSLNDRRLAAREKMPLYGLPCPSHHSARMMLVRCFFPDLGRR